MSQSYVFSVNRICSVLLVAVALNGSFSYASTPVEFGYIVSSQSAPVYLEPSLKSQVLNTLHATQRLTGAVDDVLVPHWLRYDSGYGTVGWLRRADVATFKEMRMVTGCWPIRQVQPAIGESTFDHIDFQLTGDAKLTDNFSRPWRAHTYIKDALIFVSPLDKSKDAPFGEFFSLRRSPIELRPGDEPATQFLLNDEKSLANCKDVKTR
jgi:hypothetical protein